MRNTDEIEFSLQQLSELLEGMRRETEEFTRLENERRFRRPEKSGDSPSGNELENLMDMAAVLHEKTLVLYRDVYGFLSEAYRQLLETDAKTAGYFKEENR